MTLLYGTVLSLTCLLRFISIDVIQNSNKSNSGEKERVLTHDSHSEPSMAGKPRRQGSEAAGHSHSLPSPGRPCLDSASLRLSPRWPDSEATITTCMGRDGTEQTWLHPALRHVYDPQLNGLTGHLHVFLRTIPSFYPPSLLTAKVAFLFLLAQCGHHLSTPAVPCSAPCHPLLPLAASFSTTNACF